MPDENTPPSPRRAMRIRWCPSLDEAAKPSDAGAAAEAAAPPRRRGPSSSFDAEADAREANRPRTSRFDAQCDVDAYVEALPRPGRGYADDEGAQGSACSCFGDQARRGGENVRGTFPPPPPLRAGTFPSLSR